MLLCDGLPKIGQVNADFTPRRQVCGRTVQQGCWGTLMERMLRLKYLGGLCEGDGDEVGQPLRNVAVHQRVVLVVEALGEPVGDLKQHTRLKQPHAQCCDAVRVVPIIQLPGVALCHL